MNLRNERSGRPVLLLLLRSFLRHPLLFSSLFYHHSFLLCFLLYFRFLFLIKKAEKRKKKWKMSNEKVKKMNPSKIQNEKSDPYWPSKFTIEPSIHNRAFYIFQRPLIKPYCIYTGKFPFKTTTSLAQVFLHDAQTLLTARKTENDKDVFQLDMHVLPLHGRLDREEYYPYGGFDRQWIFVNKLGHALPHEGLIAWAEDVRKEEYEEDDDDEEESEEEPEEKEKEERRKEFQKLATALFNASSTKPKPKAKPKVIHAKKTNPK